MKCVHKPLLVLLLFFLMISFQMFCQSPTSFKVVLDAGHGGHDPGTIRHGFVEKDIALKVTLKVGALLEKHQGIEVVYTRRTDVFMELKERANFANKAHANLFVSVHCNGVKSPEPFGTETFVMGMTRNASNLEVAKKENSVIFLEKDYKIKYAGFDPNSPETMIGLKLQQEEHLEQSIALASKIQNGFTGQLRRKNRGVKQAPIWVLDATAMPSVLVELGFLTNKPEGTYLNSEKGQNELAQQIAQAIIQYKTEYYGSGSIVTEIKPIQQTTPIPDEPDAVKDSQNIPQDSKGVVFKVQLAASSRKIDTSPSNFKGLSPVTSIQEGNLYKYLYGEFTSYEKAVNEVQVARNKGYDSAFLIAFRNGKKISVQEAIQP